nr:LamG-like jellyroll fold domain-containing protein [Spirosoma liriopis]
MKKTLRTYIVGILISSLCGLTLWSCDPWELPTRKERRNCITPSGELVTQIQQLKVDFSISKSAGTIDQVIWDFGDGTNATTIGTTTSHTYAKTGTYTAKAKLTNSCQKDIGIQATVNVNNAVQPAVSIQPATDITRSSAAIRMAVTSTGNSTIVRYGICYSTTNTNPEVGKTDVSILDKTDAVSLNNPVSFAIPNLQPNTTYYVRSFAINEAGIISYSDPIQFKTGYNPSVSSGGSPTVGSTTATVGFILNDAGNPAAIQYGVLYSSSNSTPSMDNSGPGVTVNNPNVGASTPVNLTDLKPNTTYYYRSYAKLPSGEIVLGPVNTFTTQADAVANGLIAYLPFTDRSLLDVSGNNNHANLVDSPTFTTDRRGKSNAAIQLDGVNDYFYMVDNSTLLLDAFTISIWIRPSAINNVNNRMQIYNKSRWSDSNFEMYSSLVKINENGPGLTFMTNIKQGSNCVPAKGWQSFEFSSNPQLDDWHHLVFTYSGRSSRMYFDNVLMDQNNNLPAASMDRCPGGELKFGAQLRDFPNYFKGAMDEIRIYNRALSASEVQTLYNQ